MSAEFLITALVVVLLPGTGVIYTLTVGLARGARAATVAAFGCTLGIVPHVAATVLGLAALLHASALAFETIRILGVAYLLFMAWSVWRAGGAVRLDGHAAPSGALRVVRDAVLLNVLNPKLSLFFLAFLPQFVPTDAARPTLALLGLAGTFMAMTFAVFVIYGACAAAARDAVLARPAVMAWLRRTFAAAFALMGLRLALAER